MEEIEPDRKDGKGKLQNWERKKVEDNANSTNLYSYKPQFKVWRY